MSARYRVVTALRRLLRLDRERRWTRAWAEGGWDWLDRIDELAHYSVIAGYVLQLRPGGRVLDVGCGSGVLVDRLDPRAFRTYLGVDFAEPIRQAATRATPDRRFVVGDLNLFGTDERFDTIIFNESLYYAADPAATLVRYAAMLDPGGIFVISMHTAERNASRWDAVDHTCQVIDAVTVENARGTRWIVKAVAPASVA